MATYAIGDVQGCFSELEKLLTYIQFDHAKDRLWFAGDLINRGSQSLATIQFIKNLGPQHKVVLGNHDLHFLAVALGAHPGWKEDTFEDILKSSDRDELIHWLLQQPLIHHDATLNYTMAHAGLAPQWDLATALSLSKEVETTLQGENALHFFQNMYGNQPNLWDETLTGWDRLRCITNYFTRMRCCDNQGRLDLEHKGTLAATPTNMIPWFNVPSRKNADLNIVFGHWAALAGVTNCPNTFALDTGCIWGYSLTAMCLDNQKMYSVSCKK